MTDPQELISVLANSKTLPEEAIDTCLTHRDQTVPAFLALLTKAADGEGTDDDEAAALFLIVHLLGEMNVMAACAPLLRLLARDEDTITRFLGDALTETIPRVIISVYDGDADALYGIMNNPDADDFARDSVFRAWSYLVATETIDRARAERYLIECSESLLPRAEHHIWASWADAVAALGLEDLRPRVERAFARGFISPAWVDLEDFEHDLQRTLTRDGEGGLPPSWDLEPFTDTIGTLSTWHAFSGDQDEEILDDAELRDDVAAWDAQPVVNPYRGVGRNDPCPCGSGKKFKKCCLQ